MKTSETSTPQQPTANTTTTINLCKYFNRANGCRFGDKCRYRHEKRCKEITQKEDADVKTKIAPEVGQFKETSEVSENFRTTILNESVIDGVSEKPKGAVERSRDQGVDSAIPFKQRQIRRPICRYFLKSGYCRDGEKCRFFHQSNICKSNKISSIHSDKDPQSSANHENSEPTKQANLLKPERPEKLSELTEEDMKYLQAVEIEQLKKRFGNGELKITQESYGTMCMFTIKPSDPDWPYDVNEIHLNVIFPQEYPKQIFKTVVTDDDGDFPANFTKHINGNIEKHLKEHEEAQKLRDSPDLLFRPFLRWLDRNLENLFTKALKQIKLDVEAMSAGLEFITFDNKDGKKIDDHGNGKIDDHGNDKEPEDKEGTQLDEEQPYTKSCSEDDKQITGKDETSAMFEMIEARKTSQNLKKGTEVRFRGMELHENTATVRATSLTFTVQCARCKNRDEMSNVKENTQVVLTCLKCSNAQSIVFTSSEVVHQHSSTLAYINPQGCLPIDLILSDSQLVLGCLHCSKETSIKGINYGSTKNVWCHHCHNKLDMKVESARFHQLQSANISDDKIKIVEVKKNAKKKEPPIKTGQALPDNGTCKHYKKSYRWMRFPCCGKCYPCDKCHEENEDDGHEMEQATRMICGFCSKEQTFSQRGCVSCKSNVTAVHSSHWEGGKGCRNKIKMSRGDDKKYTDRSKTVSRHAAKVDGQKKK